MKIFFLVGGLIMIISCNDSIQSPVSKDNNERLLNDSVYTSIQGYWGGTTGEPVFQINRDSIIYLGEQKSYKYILHEKDAVVFYKNGPYIMGNIHVLNDTLIFILPESGVTKAIRKK